MNLENMYESEDEDDEDFDDLRRACMVSLEETNSSLDSENEDDFEMLQIIKNQLASSSNNQELSVPLDSDNEEEDFEILMRIKNQLGLSIDEEDEDDSALETLCATRSRISDYAKLNDVQGNVMNHSPGKKKNQVHALDNEPSSEILSRSNPCENFLDHWKSQDTTVQDSEQEVHENTSIDEPLIQATSFPESAQAFVDAIRKNRSYQKFLRRKLTEIETTIEKNEKHKKNVVIVKDFQASCKRITKQALSQSKDPRIELNSTPKCSSKGNDKKTSSPLTLGPPKNPSVATYKMAFEKYSFSVDRKNWTQKENENLAKGLKQQLQETLIREATDDLEGSLDDIDTILEGIKNLEITPEMIRQFLPKVNWDQLDIKNRSAAECEARWMSTEDPLINNSSTWTKAEDDYIRLVTENKSYTDWLDIAVSLGTNRTPFQCLVRYQRSWNPNMLKSEWTPEEEDQLRTAVDLLGEKNWPAVANALQGRNRSQCSNKWKECKERKGWSCSKKIRKRWSSQEVKRLKIAMTFFGAENWHRIARFIPGRTDSQCSAKWKETLDHRVNHGKWTEEENAKLLEATKEHGVGKWAKIASHFLVELDVNAESNGRERPVLVIDDFLELAKISVEHEKSRTIAPKKKKRKERQKKSDGAATERQPKRRRKGYLERSLGDVCSRQENENVCENIEANNEGEVTYLEWHNEFEDYVKENNKHISVAETSSNNSSVIKKLKPRRKVSVSRSSYREPR